MSFIVPPSPVDEACTFQFHQYVMYDNVNWTAAGNLYFDQPTGHFTVNPNPMISGLYYYDALNSTWTSINFNPTPGSSGAMYYDDNTKTITLT